MHHLSVENPRLDRGSAMNASSTELHRKIRRTAGRAPSEAADASGGVENAAEKGRLKQKNLEMIKGPLEAL